MNGTARITASGVDIVIGARSVCRNLDIELRSGENWAILGANGAGKTTLLKTLAGLRPASAGSVQLDQRPVTDWAPRDRARQLGVLFQDDEDSLPATVMETVLAGRHPHLSRWQWESDHDMDLALTALAAVDLAGFERRELDTLSGGERRRANIALLLTQNPSLCMLDEPVNHLDPRHALSVLELFTRRARRPGHANVMVLHDPNLALRYCSHCLMLFGDGSFAQGPVAQSITRETLESLYRCPMREFADAGERVFIPAA